MIRLSGQLQTVSDCQDNGRKLQTIADMSVLVCSMEFLPISGKGGGTIMTSLSGKGHSKLDRVAPLITDPFSLSEEEKTKRMTYKT